MLGKPEWFGRRKYGGWGISPKTWQGWAYLAFAIVPFAVFQSMPFWSNATRITVTAIWFLVLLMDVLDIMMRMKKDEREFMHEAIAERNALWVTIFVLTAGIAYQIAASAASQRIQIDPFMAAALFGALIAKSISNIYLDRRH